MAILDYQHPPRRTGSRSPWLIAGSTIALFGFLVSVEMQTSWATAGGSRPAQIEIDVLDDATGKPIPNATLTPSAGSSYGFFAGNTATDAAGRGTFRITISAARNDRLFHTTTFHRSPSFDAMATGYIPARVKVSPKNATTVFGIGQSNHLKASVRLTPIASNKAE